MKRAAIVIAVLGMCYWSFGQSGETQPALTAASANAPQQQNLRYESCPWIWHAKNVPGWHDSVSPVHEVINEHWKCRDFGRWVVKHHPEMDPQFDPDSPSYIGMSYHDDEPVDAPTFSTNGEGQSARRKYIAKYREYNEIEELEWTP